MIEIFDQIGEVKQYLSVSERLTAFLEVYGPDKGFRIESKVNSYLSIHEGLAGVYKAALESGQGNSALPAIDPTLFCFEARLLDKEDRIVAQATSLRRVDPNLGGYAWESGETAALQRLMARLGHGSDTLLADEMGDMARQGVKFQPETPPSDDSGQPESESDTPASEAEKPVPDKSKPKPQTKAQPTKPAQPAAKSKQAKGSGEVAESVVRQIHRLAAQRGIEPPEVSTKAEAKAALKKLRETSAEA